MNTLLRDAGAVTDTLEPGRLARVKTAYTTRRIDLSQAATVITGDVAPVRGDLLLASVSRIRQHTRIELPNGRRARLHIGDEVLVCYGDRYAPDQFESRIPDNLGPCHLVAAGGVASLMTTRHQRMKPATELMPIGLVGDSEGRRINLHQARIGSPSFSGRRPFTFAVAGTSMNAGKTTAAAHLIKGLDKSGLRVGAAKITGTGSGGDVWFMFDSGADPVVDFTDAGFVSTYRASQHELEEILATLTSFLARQNLDVIVLEVADGIMQTETAAILESPEFKRLVDRMIFTAGDAMGAAAGSRWLVDRGLNVTAISGSLTASPLSMRETEQAADMQVLDTKQLADPLTAGSLLETDLVPMQVAL
ncbi:MAG: DUF1611 domain-containing protein [Gammaproteobacteria bacterium]|nr:DUF1611 domain-containing protein [Gammaproteobacteria bacterium]